MDHCPHGDARHFYGSAGYQRGQRGASAHCRQPVGYPEEATWVLTSYLVANAIILPMGAWFSMLIGRKRFLHDLRRAFYRQQFSLRHGAALWGR
jgi:hypothetical protein